MKKKSVMEFIVFCFKVNKIDTLVCYSVFEMIKVIVMNYIWAMFNFGQCYFKNIQKFDNAVFSAFWVRQ